MTEHARQTGEPRQVRPCMRRPSLGVRFGLVLFAMAVPVSATTKKECATSYVQAQKLKRASSLLQARKELIVCASEDCLSAVRKDCLTWLDEVNAAIPSITVSALDTSGKETLDVKVEVDGKPVAEKLETNGIELDPGPHTLRFQLKGGPTVEKQIILHAGEKNKLVEVSFAGKSTPAPSATNQSKPPPDLRPRPHEHTHTLSYVLGGVGVAALIGTTYFWISSKSAEHDLDASGCAPHCNPSDVDAIKRKRLFGDIAFGAGVVSLGIATYLWFNPPKRERSSPVAGVDMRVLRGGAYGSVSGRF